MYIFFHITRRDNMFCEETYFFMALCNILFLFLHCSTYCLEYYTYFSRSFHSFTWFFIIRYDHDDYERTTGKKALTRAHHFLLLGAVNFPSAFDYLSFYFFYRVCYTFSFLFFIFRILLCKIFFFLRIV